MCVCVMEGRATELQQLCEDHVSMVSTQTTIMEISINNYLSIIYDIQTLSPAKGAFPTVAPLLVQEI